MPLESVNGRLQHAKIHSQDSSNIEGARLDKMTRSITMTGDLDKAQLARLLEIADKCPVHKSLEQGIDIETDSPAL